MQRAAAAPGLHLAVGLPCGGERALPQDDHMALEAFVMGFDPRQTLRDEIA